MYRFLSMTLACVLALGATVAANAKTLTVPSQKYPTIQSAVNGAKSGDKITINGGIHQEHVSIGGPTLLNQVNLEIDGENGATLINDGDPIQAAISINSSGNSVHGLTIRNYVTGISVSVSARVYNNTITGCGTGISVAVAGDGNLPAPTSIDHNLVYANFNGIDLEGSQNVTVSQNTATNNTGQGAVGTGIVISSSDHCLVTSNIVSANDEGILLLGCPGDVTVTQNTVMNNGLGAGGVGVAVQLSNNCTVTSNLVTANGEGIQASFFTSDCTFTYNISVGNQGLDAENSIDAGANTWAHNIFGRTSGI